MPYNFYRKCDKCKSMTFCIPTRVKGRNVGHWCDDCRDDLDKKVSFSNGFGVTKGDLMKLLSNYPDGGTK